MRKNVRLIEMEGVPCMAEEFNLDGMVDIYIYENGQLLENLEEIVLETKDDDAFDENSINEIFRIMHTIKGSSGVMMYDNIMKVSHKLEDIFYYLRENIGIEEPHMELTDIVFQVLDFINGEMEKIKDGNDPDGDNTQLIDLMEKFLVKLKGVIDSSGGNSGDREPKACLLYTSDAADEMRTV